MLFTNPRILYIALFASFLVFFYNIRITSSWQSYNATETVVSGSSHTSPDIPSIPIPSEVAKPDIPAPTIPSPVLVLVEERPPGKSDAEKPVEGKPDGDKSKEQEGEGEQKGEEESKEPEHIDTPEEIAQKAAQAAKDALEREFLWADNSTRFMSASRAALIIEDRALPNIVPLILHFASVLGPNWPIILYTKTAAPSTSAALNRMIKSHRVYIRALPSFVVFGNQVSVSRFMTSPWIWNELAPANHVLVFQADSIVCSNSPMTIDDFTKWDLIGAPIAELWGQGYNGGLSLRNRNVMLKVIHNSVSDNDDGDNSPFEDQWFYTKMKALPPNADGTPGANLPSETEAMKFAVETIDYEKPFGYHQARRWQKDNLAQIEEWCPEVRLATGILLINDNLTEEEAQKIKDEKAAKEKEEAEKKLLEELAQKLKELEDKTKAVEEKKKEEGIKMEES